MSKRKCPINCPCICHDTGGSGHNHEGRRCPGKEPARRAELRRQREAEPVYNRDTANRGVSRVTPPPVPWWRDRDTPPSSLTLSMGDILGQDYEPRIREQLNSSFLIVDSLTDIQDRIVANAVSHYRSDVDLSKPVDLKYNYGYIRISPQVRDAMMRDISRPAFGNRTPLPAVTTGYYERETLMSPRPTTASALRKQLKAIEKQIEALDKFGEDDYPDETVLFYKTNFGREYDATQYTYTALKVHGGWYLSGKTTGPVSWDTLVDRHLQFATEVWVADAWTAL